ncbi:N protein [Southwest baboon virus 1]|uniref:N protein n=1 Tax=Southwest baboon virus 1 TaxID=1546178 RepID=UPI0004F6F75B|nr:N protein [Southwest baboon virus 1]AIP91336.1 N protein [Southwest baboon virus 1]AIP91350.1 N protein [Southwest baboon virus 1]AIP91364.1 N protein [Southwest baboon virus 1]
MAGRKQNNQKRNRAPTAAPRTRRGPRLPQRSAAPPRRTGGQPQPTNHYVFAEPGDVRLMLNASSAAQMRSLVFRYYDNGGGSLTYDGQRLNFAAIITPDSHLAKLLARFAPSNQN